MQSDHYREAMPNIFNSNSAHFPTTYALLLIKSQSSQNCIIIQFERIFMRFWGILSISIVKIKLLFYTLFYICSVKQGWNTLLFREPSFVYSGKPALTEVAPGIKEMIIKLPKGAADIAPLLPKGKFKHTVPKNLTFTNRLAMLIMFRERSTGIVGMEINQ